MKPGDKIDNYTLLYECGRGAFGTVYFAQADDGKYVAFKAVSLFGDAGNRELQALESYQKCAGSNCLLKIYQVVMKDQFFYYTMEAADGISVEGSDSDKYIPCTLAEVLERNNKLSVKQTTELVLQLLEALEVIHSNGLVHRDIKPANIFWINKRAKLGDIGLLANDNSMTFKAGSPYFIPLSTSCISPNSTAVDLYAMTRLIYCCLSGKSADEYPVLDPTDDIFDNGQRLLQIMNMSDEDIAKASVKSFQNIIGKTTIITPNILASVGAFVQTSESCSVSDSCSMSCREEETLSSLPILSDLVNAESWIQKCGINKKNVLVATAVGGAAMAGTAVTGGVTAISAAAGAVGAGGAAALTTGIAAAAPIALPALGAYLLYKKLSKKK